MGAATAASRGIGFIRIWAIATILGTTYLGNTYQSSSAVSNVLFELLAAGALSAVLVPTFVRHLEHDDPAEAERLAGGVLGLALGVLGVIALAGFLLAPQIAHLIASGAPEHLKADQQRLATFLTRFFVFQVLLYAIGTVSTAVLFAQRRFVAFALAPIANTVAVVGALIVFRVLAGPHPTLDLTGTEELVLALGGMLGVIGFIGVPTVALAALRVPPASPPRSDRPRAPPAPQALDVGRPPARGHRDPARGGHRRRQPGGGRRHRVPVRLRGDHGALRHPRRARAHHDPPRAEPRRGRGRPRPLREPAALGPRQHGDARDPGLRDRGGARAPHDARDRRRAEQGRRRRARRGARLPRPRLVPLQRVPALRPPRSTPSTTAAPRLSSRWSPPWSAAGPCS